MKKWSKNFLYLTLLLIGTQVVGSIAPDEKGLEPRGREYYRIIEERNIFSPRARKLSLPEQTQAIPQEPRNYFMLTGIVETGTRRLALIEDKRAHWATFLREGEEIEGMRLERIYQLTVAIRGDFGSRVVALGEALTGTEPVEEVLDTTEPPQTQEKISPSLRAIEQRMKERRRREEASPTHDSRYTTHDIRP